MRRAALWLAIAVLFLAALWLRTQVLGAADLTEDEELATSLPRVSYGGIFSDIAGRPPVTFLIQKAFIDLRGGDTSPTTLRLPGAMAGALSVVVMFLWLRAAAGARAGLVGAALLAFNAFHIHWSRDARYYPFLALAALVCLWGLWRGAVRDRWSGWVLFAAGLLLAPLTHFSGYLFAAAVCAVLPLVALIQPWRGRLMKNRRMAGRVAAGLVAGGVVAGFVLRGSLTTVTKHLAWPDFSKPLPPFFDVSPDFLWNRLSDATALRGEWLVLWVILFAMGAVYAALRRPLLLAVAASVTVLPFLLFYLFPPNHPWHLKYFIYMLPVLLGITAVGIDVPARLVDAALSRAHASAALRRGTGAALAAAGAVLLLAPAAELPWMQREPMRAMQRLGAELTAWSGPRDVYHYSWPERWRVLRHHFPPMDTYDQAKQLSADVPFPLPFATAESRPWFLFDGKVETPASIAAELLSPRFSRVPYEGGFVCATPNMQLIVFGQSVPGRPEAAGPLVLGPGEEYTLWMLCPHPHVRTVEVEMESTLEQGVAALEVSAQGQELVRFASPAPGRHTQYAGRWRWERGPVAVRLKNVAPQPLRIHSMGFPPVVEADSALEIPAWDFLVMVGEAGLDSVWPEETEGGYLLRDWRRGHSTVYRFYNARGSNMVVRVAALNDPPFANRYQLYFPNTKLKFSVLEFGLENGEVSMEESLVYPISEGIHELALGYLGIAREELEASTRNGRAWTQETLQNCGVLSLTLERRP